MNLVKRKRRGGEIVGGGWGCAKMQRDARSGWSVKIFGDDEPSLNRAEALIVRDECLPDDVRVIERDGERGGVLNRGRINRVRIAGKSDDADEGNCAEEENDRAQNYGRGYGGGTLPV